jgi:hypothetical protein
LSKKSKIEQLAKFRKRQLTASPKLAGSGQ